MNAALKVNVIDGADRFRGKWLQHVGIARLAWARLSEADLLRTRGQKGKLAALIQLRYAVALPAANDAVERLAGKCGY